MYKFKSIKNNPNLDHLAEISGDIVYSNAGGKPITMRVELTERGILPSRYAKPYMTVLDGRTYEVTGDTMEEVLFRA